MASDETENVNEAAGGAEATPTEKPAATEAPAPTPSQAPPAPDPVAAITAERDKMKDQLLRALADFDNFRKRSRRDIDDAKKRGQEEILRELLPVFDNLERASAYARSATDTKAIAEGVEMVLKLFLDTVTRLGGTRVQSVGTPFDPNMHEAIQQMDSDEYAAGIIVQEHVCAYEYNGRLLRPAMVVVSKGPGPAAVTPAVDVADAGGESAN